MSAEAALDYMRDLIENPEELHPYFADWTEETELGTSIRHPLVYSVMHAPFMNRHVNAALTHKRKMLAQAEAEGDWDRFEGLSAVGSLVQVAVRLRLDKYGESR